MSLKPQAKKLSGIQALSFGAGFVFILSVAGYGFIKSNERPSISVEKAEVALSIVAESPFTQVKTTSEFLGVVTAFLNIIEPNPEGYPPLYLAGFGLGSPSGLQAFLAEAEHYPVSRIMRTHLDSSEAYRTYEQATDYYKVHHKPKDSPISQAEIDDFNKSMIKALDRLPTIAGYMALSAVDAYRGMVEGSPKHIGSYAKSPRPLPSREALDAMPVFKDLREKFEEKEKVDFVIGESLSSALGALAALVTYDSDKHTDEQYELAYDFVNRVVQDQPEAAASVKLSQALFTRSYEHAVSYLNRVKEHQGVKLRDRDKGILVYQILESLARQKDPAASLKLATHTLEYWSTLDPYFKSRDRFSMIMDPDYRTSTMAMFESRIPDFDAYVAELTKDERRVRAHIEAIERQRDQNIAKIKEIVDAQQAKVEKQNLERAAIKRIVEEKEPAQ